MKTEQDVIYLKDYRPYPFRITHSDIEFFLDAGSTRVVTQHSVQRRENTDGPLVLDCEKLELISIAIDGERLSADRFEQSEKSLTIFGSSEQFTLTIENSICPAENTELSGLYRSADMLCTQCEAEGFRRITPSIDRPDNLATYRVTLHGAIAQYPVLLCNGNLESQETRENNLVSTWYDPFPKPTYLFAIVAGNLSLLKDTFTTCSGRQVDLHFYAHDSDIEKCEYAMSALKRAMAWDEEIYGREYDLDLFNVVAVGDFNMGAMENKSLNIFNTKYVLADPEIATDSDFLNVESVIAHEYFHNWTGNRVTCRDWFQLSLKEGLTVFRDQQFSADMNSAGVKRIADVNLLRNHQFPEDAGPMAHPVRPESYKEIDNFYTVTVYEKGAEVVRMLHTLVGNKMFRQGTDLYFDRHDGEAVTTDDFVAAISDASGLDLEQFKLWYSQAGTPRVSVTSRYDQDNHRLTLRFTQSVPANAGSPTPEPFLIPIRIALLSPEGEKIPLADATTEVILQLNQQQQEFEFENIPSDPAPSILRGFSSPIILEAEFNQQEIQTIFLHDDDAFNRWEAGQRMFQHCILDNIARLQQGKPCRYDPSLIDLIGDFLESIPADLALAAKLLTLPGHTWLAEQSKPIDPESIAAARKGLQQAITHQHYDKLTNLYLKLQQVNSGALVPSEIAARSLRDSILGLLSTLDVKEIRELALNQYRSAKNMTDRMSALTSIADSSSEQREAVLEEFYEQWKHEPLAVDKWLRVQATEESRSSLSRIEALCEHPAFEPTNPNKVFALILGFSQGNPIGFHLADGSGYAFLADWVKKMDKINPQIAARLASGFNMWRDMIPALSKQMRTALEDIDTQPSLSPNVGEIIGRALGADQ